MNSQIDLSSEMLITRHLNGVVLVRPDYIEDGAMSRPIALSELSEMPYNVFFHNPNHRLLEANEICAVNCGFDSRAAALGRHVRDVCNNVEQVTHVLMNNQRVTSNNELVIADEQLDLWNGKFTHTISFKFPWYDNFDSVIGVFGCAVHVNENDAVSVTEQLTQITRQFVSTPAMKLTYKLGKRHDKRYFSSREMEVIKYVMRGKTMREIGEILGLSRRTIESYFENIKVKANVKSKSELFDKILNSDFSSMF